MKSINRGWITTSAISPAISRVRATLFWQVLLAAALLCCGQSLAGEMTVQEYQAAAVKRYPALGVAGSPLNSEFLRIVADLRVKNASILTRPLWPLVLADVAARNLKIAPIPDKSSEASRQHRRLTPKENEDADKERSQQFVDQWAAQPFNSDRFVEPGDFAVTDGPSYQETLEFLNAKLAPLMSIGFGEKTGKMIFRCKNPNGFPFYTMVFDPHDLNVDMLWEMNMGQCSVRFQTKDGREKITIYRPNASFLFGKTEILGIDESSTNKGFIIGGREFDEITAKKVANAFSHLIYMLGGTKDPF
jgi:hypothetical protein